MKIYNTLTRRKEEFIPQGDEVKIYVCGITPYDFCHVGHALSYTFFDTLRRYLEYKGYKVKYVQNFTDIDDKIIERAKKLNTTPKELAEKYIKAYFEDMDKLNIKRADIYPRVTEEIGVIVEMIRVLIDKGYAYERGGDVYFRVRRDVDYGKLSGRRLEDMRAYSEPSEGKEDPLDFALWKAHKPGEPYWDSPWGRGRPGWHIECSAMAIKYLGETIDIHGGGEDLIFPHHENEIAQSESYTGKTFVRYWVHNALLKLGGEKMSKSTGKLISLREALSKFNPDALRLFLLSSHYRTPLSYSEEGIRGMERALLRVRSALFEEGGEGEELDPEPFMRKFIEAMDDDLDTPKAIASMFELAREINRGREEGKDIRRAQERLREMTEILGLRFEEKKLDIEPVLEILIDVRDRMRKERRWDIADMIRERLGELGIILEDTPKGTRWRIA